VNKIWLRFALIISVSVGIIFPLSTTSKPIDWNWFFYLVALSVSLVCECKRCLALKLDRRFY
jgi:hypothetical protein